MAFGRGDTGAGTETGTCELMSSSSSLTKNCKMVVVCSCGRCKALTAASHCDGAGFDSFVGSGTYKPCCGASQECGACEHRSFEMC